MLPAQKDQAVQAIRNSYNLLSTERDLSPHNARINRSLTQLVRTLARCQPKEALAAFLTRTPDLAVERARLPELCGMAECEMEKFWAQKLLACPSIRLADFWYFREYQELCLAEMDMFSPHRFRRITFLGSGALPLTAFLLAEHCPSAKITCVDCDAEACDLSRRLACRLGLQDRIDVRCMNAAKYVPEEDELVICASLLRGHEDVYRQLDKSGCGLIVRDSEGPYQYLYKPAKLPDAHFRQVAKTAPSPRRINTSRYYRHV